MTAQSRPAGNQQPKRLLKAVLLTGLLAGTLDGSAAVIKFIIPAYRNPVRIFQYIASGIFGPEVFSQSPWMAVWGLIFHYMIATTWTLLFFFAYPKIRFLATNKVAAGLGYGVVVWLIMNLVVLPLSNVPPGTFNLTQAAIGMIILMLAIGLPISLMANKHYSNK